MVGIVELQNTHVAVYVTQPVPRYRPSGLPRDASDDLSSSQTAIAGIIQRCFRDDGLSHSSQTAVIDSSGIIQKCHLKRPLSIQLSRDASETLIFISNGHYQGTFKSFPPPPLPPTPNAGFVGTRKHLIRATLILYIAGETLFAIPSLPSDIPKTLILLSDGKATDSRQAEAMGLQLRNAGVIIWGIYIGNSDVGIRSMKTIASKPSETFVFQVPNTFDFGTIAREISSRSCVNATGLFSTCGVVDAIIGVNGTNLLDSEKLRCRFTFSDNTVEIVEAYRINDESLVCGRTNHSTLGDTRIEVSIDGRTYSGQDLFFTYVTDLDECDGPRPDVKIPFVFFGFILPALLILSLIGLLDHRGVAAALAKPKAPPATEELAGAAADNKWAEVKATGYLWAKSGGGSAPMKVEWAGLAPPSAPTATDGFGTSKTNPRYNSGSNSSSPENSVIDTIMESCCKCCSNTKPEMKQSLLT
ncbi:hypothetical protein AAMO2058_000889000 [Amorphochlora amoebiformis]